MNWIKNMVGLTLLAGLATGCGQPIQQQQSAPADTVPLSVLEEAQNRVKSVRAELEHRPVPCE